MTPPPLPQKIEYQIFWGRHNGALRLAGPKLLTERLQDAHQQAADWMNQHPSHQIVSISSSCAENSGGSAISLTVWYRRG